MYHIFTITQAVNHHS